MAIETVFMFIMSLPLLFIGVILATMIHPIFFLLLIVPPIFLILPWIRIRSWINERKRGIEEELPFFAIHASILQAAGRDIYNALCTLIGRAVFPQLERDAAIMKRNTTYFRISPLEGIEELGRTTPNKKMKSLLLGYTSEWRSGGNATMYLERKTEEFLKETESRWNKYSNDVSYIGEVTIVIMFLLPLLLLMTIFLSPNLGSTITTMFLVIVLPILSTVSVAIVHSTQPKSYDKIDGSFVLGFLFSAIAIAVILSVPLPLWSMIVLITGSMFLGYGLPVIFQRREIAAHESGLISFLRDITEYQKMGYDIVRATKKISAENKYNSKFDRLLARVAWQLNLGQHFSEVKVKTRSWLTRSAFFHLGELAESGAYETKSLEMLTDFIGNVFNIKKKTKGAMTLYRILSLITPVTLGLVVGVLVGLLNSFLSGVAVGSIAIPGLFEVSPFLLSMSYAIIIVASIGVAITSMYASSFTIKNTSWITLNIALAGLAIYLSQYIAEFVTGIL